MSVPTSSTFASNGYYAKRAPVRFCPQVGAAHVGLCVGVVGSESPVAYRPGWAWRVGCEAGWSCAGVGCSPALGDGDRVAGVEAAGAAVSCVVAGRTLVSVLQQISE